MMVRCVATLASRWASGSDRRRSQPTRAGGIGCIRMRGPAARVLANAATAGEEPIPGELLVRLAKVTCLALALMAVGAGARAETLKLKSGLMYSGKVAGLNDVAVFANLKANLNKKVPASCPIWMVDDGPRRLMVPGRQMAEVLDDAELSSSVMSFKIPQRKTGQQNFPIQVGTFSRVEEFDEFGHGMVQLRTGTDTTLDIVLGIVELRPDYVRIEALKYDWSFARTTQSLGQEVIDRILKKRVNRTSLIERRKLIVFYEQAEMYKAARHEVQLFVKDFPAEKKWCEDVTAQMDELDSRRVLNEITRRRSAGQHLLAYGAVKTFPVEGVSVEIRRQVEGMHRDYDAVRERRATILLQLDMLQAAIPADQAAQLKPLRSLLGEELHAVENLERLSPYEQIANAPNVTATEKLALAYSSWVVGPSDAVDSLPAAVRMWEMRFLILEYLRTPEDAVRRAAIIKTLEATEDVSVERLARMVGFLPMLEDMAPIPPCTPTRVETTSDGAGTPLSYVVILPKEYNTQHTYPLLVVLHGFGKDAESEARWWAGDPEREGHGQRRGFITIAPEYAKPNQTQHEYDLASHRAVLGSIRHAMRTHRIDANRVVLAGHGMGADACFDLGMSHPDVFAGVAPICGKSQQYCMSYWGNATKTSWYVVSGERDRDTVADNMRDLNKYFSKGIDITYSEYKNRGLEPYSEELPRLIDWAETVRRKPIQEYLDFEVKTLRSFDNHFHWIQAGTLPQELFQPIVWEDRHKKIRDMPISGKITPGGTVYVTHPGKTTTIWFSPDMINFDERVRVHVNGTEQFNGSLTPSVEALLEDLRTRADRQRLFWARLDLK